MDRSFQSLVKVYAIPVPASAPVGCVPLDRQDVIILLSPYQAGVPYPAEAGVIEREVVAILADALILVLRRSPSSGLPYPVLLAVPLKSHSELPCRLRSLSALAVAPMDVRRAPRMPLRKTDRCEVLLDLFPVVVAAHLHDADLRERDLQRRARLRSRRHRKRHRNALAYRSDPARWQNPQKQSMNEIPHFDHVPNAPSLS